MSFGQLSMRFAQLAMGLLHPMKAFLAPCRVSSTSHDVLSARELEDGDVVRSQEVCSLSRWFSGTLRIVEIST